MARPCCNPPVLNPGCYRVPSCRCTSATTASTHARPQEQQQQQDPERLARDRPRWAAERRAAAAAAAREGPVLREAPGGLGGVQGLAWYQRRQRADCDGDLADGHFEEPWEAQLQPHQDSQQQQRPQACQQQRQQQQEGGGRQRPRSGSDPPEEKRQRRQGAAAALERVCHSRTRPAGPADLLLDQGSVHVVEREPS